MGFACDRGDAAGRWCPALVGPDDPKAYSKPWTVSLSWQFRPDTDLLEYVCDENEKDPKHIVGK